MPFSTSRNPPPFFLIFLKHLSVIVSFPYKNQLQFSSWSWLNNKSNGSLSLMDKCTIYILSENDASVIIIMNIYSHIALKTYLKLRRSAFFYYYCYRVHFSRLTILNFLPIFIMENDFLIHLLKSLKLSVILKAKGKRDPICINPSHWVCSMKSYSFLMALL